MLFRPARAADLDEVCTLLATAKHGPEYFHALFMADPGFEAGQVRLAWTGGRIVACAKIYPRLLRLGPTVIPAGGIGNLRTDPRYWSKGLGSSLLSECLSAMYLEGMSLAPLFSKRHTLFARRGWHALAETELEIPPRALGATTKGEAAIRGRPVEAADLDAVMALHESANAARTGSAVRDRDAWLAYLTTLDLQGALTLVAVSEDEIVGYAAFHTDQQETEILELLLAPWAEDAWRPVLRAIQKLNGATTTLRATLPADYLRLIMTALGERVTISERDDLMMRVVDPTALLRQLVPLLTGRLREAPATETLRVRVGPLRGGAALHVEGASVSIVPPQRDDEYILPEAMFLALLLGSEGAQAQLDSLALSEAAHQTLSTLFPPQDWVFWRSDAF